MPQHWRWCPVSTALAGLLLLPACGGLATLGPTPQGEGIEIFIHANFAGTSQALNVDVRNLERVEGPCDKDTGDDVRPTWSDCISSVRVLPGWTATLYRDHDFQGRSVTLTADSPNLRELAGPCDGSFNDCVSSIKVMRP